jgi:hypothetical protein
MDATIARNIAHYGHAGQRTRRGLPRIEYVERVAAAVSEEARALAFLDDVLERTTTNVDELLANGLTAVESAALGYSCAPGESYELHVLRIVHARGPDGRLARTVKLADLDDHLREDGQQLGDPPYTGRSRRGDAARSGEADLGVGRPTGGSADPSRLAGSAGRGA